MKCGAWRVQCEVWSVKEAVGSEKCEVWNVTCEVWSVKFKFGVRRAQCEVWSVKCEVWSVKEAVRSEKCGVWSVKCGVWSLKFGVRRVQCAVWGVECRGKDTVGTGCLWTIGHLCLGNFRRRLARVYVITAYNRSRFQVFSCNQSRKCKKMQRQEKNVSFWLAAVILSR